MKEIKNLSDWQENTLKETNISDYDWSELKKLVKKLQKEAFDAGHETGKLVNKN